MQTSLHCLLEKVVDYAGLFPPAELPIEKALTNYASHLQSRDAWILGRFVLPATRLSDLRTLASNHFATGASLDLSILGRGGKTGGECLENISLDLEKIATARAHYDDRIRISVLEVPLPVIAGLNPLIRESSEQAFQSQLLPFFEIPVTRDYGEALTQAIRACLSSGRAGLKLRCGGADKANIPSVETIAQFISECVMARVPMKFTAGLHHPLFRKNARLKTIEHGFINVLMAAVLTVEHCLAPPTLCAVLREENPAAFHWNADEVGWGEYRVHSSEVELARRFAAVSFGSCTFDELCADLRALKWM